MKDRWTNYPIEVEAQITKLAEELGMSFAEFTRNATYSIFLLIKQHGIENLSLIPTKESKIKRMIIKKDSNPLK